MYFTLPCTGVRRQVVIAACVYMGCLVIGYTVGWTAPVIPKLKDPGSSPLPGEITDLQMSFVGSILYIGGLAGPYLGGYISNKRGRKSCTLVGASCVIVAYLILGNASTLVTMYIGRFMSGFGTGMTMVMALVYLGEVASTEIRGIFLTGIGVFITGGSLLVFSIGPFISYSAVAYIGAVLSTVHALTILWIPESPIYYALKGKEGAVKKVLEELGRINDFEKVLTTSKAEDSIRDWKELFILKGNRRALCITICLNLFQHGSGITAVTFFATSIFELAGSNVQPALATIILGSTQLLGGLITPIFIERTGRQKLLSISSAICSLSMLFLGVYFYLRHVDHWAVLELKWMPLVSLIIFFIGYDLGLGIIPNALAGEMFMLNVRSKGCAVAITASWLFGFSVSTAFGSLIAVVGGHILFWFFSGVCALSCLYTVFFVPETKGKSLKEIQMMLSK